MRSMTAEQMAAVAKRNLEHRAPTDREVQRDRNIERMRGCAGDCTTAKWAQMLGVSEKVVRSYARELGEKCKRAEYKRAERTPGEKRRGPQKERREAELSSMMAKWATRPIR